VKASELRAAVERRGSTVTPERAKRAQKRKPRKVVEARSARQQAIAKHGSYAAACGVEARRRDPAAWFGSWGWQ